MTDKTSKASAESLLKKAVGDPKARFRDGQWEAIDALVNRRRKTMLVQRTGWGKSSVYFISTSVLRDGGAGPTLIVSPLLALMRNQIEQAERLGIRAETINSTNSEHWPEIKRRIKSDETDVLLISPERLADESFVENELLSVSHRIGLLVVDEAHCISDWGHDFRPDYKRLVNVLRHMPSNMPVLATTATANKRVVDDVVEQLGDLDVRRGPLRRRSLTMQNLRLPGKASRLAWLAQSVNELPGSGIVYVLTKRDAEEVATWLREKKINAQPYHGGMKAEPRIQLEESLKDNRVKALVATTALGMDYDKPDLGFVVHYQAPGSIVAYYQQAGRAGRAISEAFCVLLAGGEDEKIIEYFRRSAFPEEKNVSAILETLESGNGMTVFEMQSELNLTYGQIMKVLKVLSVENPAPFVKDGSKWRRTPVPYDMDNEQIARLNRQREIEWREVQRYVDSETCLMAYLCRVLDDPETDDCGCCAACLGEPVVDSHVPENLRMEAERYLKRPKKIPFTPKQQAPRDAFPEYGLDGGELKKNGAREGRILCRWGDTGWGEMVESGKNEGKFSDTLVKALAEMIERWNPQPRPEWVACVPSQNHETLVPDFAERLAKRLGLGFVKVAIRKKRDNELQKMQQNSFHQARNLDGVFSVSGSVPKTPVLLVDDIIDSGWTMTVLAVLLRRGGSGDVYPVALALTSRAL